MEARLFFSNGFPTPASSSTVLPGVACLVILIAGLAEKSRRLTTTAWALGQAALLAYLITCCYKTFTGRPLPSPPPHFHPGPGGHDLIDSSHGFHFGFLKGSWFLGLAVGAFLRGVFHVCLFDNALSQEQDSCSLGAALCVLHRL